MKNTKFTMITILLIPIGIAINFVGGQIAFALKLPLFIDSIGTILVGVLAGSLLGGTTGLLTNIILSITNPSSIIWAPVNVLIGLVAGFCAKHNLFKKPLGAVITIIAIWGVSVLASVPISVLAFGGATGSGASLITSFLISTGRGLWQSVFSSTIITESLDKVLSVLVAYVIVYSIPKRTISKFPLGNKYIKGNDRDEEWDD
ncbi:ECF transporter S component [Oceanivirga salmonicida]|uniref:ECF transporter S component n=1 Tax=Oceanivirga salmonicida TaxID=1769291 RepID=UPI0012E1C094|nr:ECF transporter S component [Oceanivirga salmonicida]